MGFGYSDQQERTTGLTIDPGNNELLAQNYRAGELESASVSLSTGNWYYGHTHIQPSIDTIYAELMDTNGTQLSEVSLKTSEDLNSRNDQSVHLILYTWQGNEHHSFFDELEYRRG
jgi:hypothetical protein